MTATPKEKAQELVDKFRMNVLDYEGSGLNTFKAKQCALIAIDEILDNFGLVCNGKTFFTEHRAFDYYSEVKKELIKSE